MSNIYVTEPPPSGKVVLETSRGEIEVELFADQCPLACKNFIALALEGYYDNVTWHRYMRDFIVQTGDPTGTGVGGESFYGHEFADEPHQRLRFNRRGLLGMANGADRNSNASQFFFTLSATPELQGKHTMFGRINNNTIYNLVALVDSIGEVDAEDRPLHPPKLRTVRVVENPFEGQLQLRITREERLAMKRNRKEAEQRKKERGGETGGGRKVKNKSLLSFGDEDDGEGEETIALKGPKSSHDLLKGDKRLRSDPHIDDTSSVATRTEKPVQHEKRSRTEERVDDKPTSLADVREQFSEEGRKRRADEERIAALEASLRGERTEQKSAERSVKVNKSRGREMLEEYRAKYAKSKKSSSEKRDEETLRLLKSFQTRSEKHKNQRSKENGKNEANGATEDDIPEDMREYGASDEDDDAQGWRNHRFDFGGKAVVEDQHDGAEYVTLDPRDSASSAAVRLGFGGREGQERAREQRSKEGRRGRDWVEARRWDSAADGRGAEHMHRRKDRR